MCFLLSCTLASCQCNVDYHMVPVVPVCVGEFGPPCDCNDRGNCQVCLINKRRGETERMCILGLSQFLKCSLPNCTSNSLFDIVCSLIHLVLFVYIFKNKKHVFVDFSHLFMYASIGTRIMMYVRVCKVLRYTVIIIFVVVFLPFLCW